MIEKISPKVEAAIVELLAERGKTGIGAIAPGFRTDIGPFYEGPDGGTVILPKVEVLAYLSQQ